MLEKRKQKRINKEIKEENGNIFNKMRKNINIKINKFSFDSLTSLGVFSFELLGNEKKLLLLLLLLFLFFGVWSNFNSFFKNIFNEDINSLKFHSLK